MARTIEDVKSEILDCEKKIESYKIHGYTFGTLLKQLQSLNRELKYLRLMTWTPVEDDLPKCGEVVQITFLSARNNITPSCDGTAYINKFGEWSWWLDNSEVTVKVTAWKPLCEPYRGNK